MAIIEKIFMYFIGFFATTVAAYIFLRVCTKAVANSWYEVKLKVKEESNGEKTETQDDNKGNQKLVQQQEETANSR